MNLRAIKSVANHLSEYDLIDFLKAQFAKISVLDKKTFLWIFISLNCVFLFHTVSFLWGGHDWSYMKNGVAWEDLLYNGRFSAFFIKIILINGQILPIINNVVAFFFYALGITLLLNYWDAPQNLSQRVIIGLTLTITPYTLCWLWYAYHTIENLTIPLLVVSALILSDKTRKNVLCHISAMLLVLLALGIYPSAVVCILTVFSAKILIDTINDKNLTLKDFFNNYKNIFINIILAGCIYEFILLIFDEMHLLADIKNIQHADLAAIITDIPIALRAFFTQLFNYQIVDHNELTGCFLVLICILMIWGFYFAIKYRKLHSHKTYLIILFGFLLLLATKTAVILSVDPMVIYTAPRIDFYGLVLFRGFIVLLLFKYAPTVIKNIVYIICFVIIWHCILTDSMVIKAVSEGSKVDKLIANRIVFLIENNPAFNIKTKYNMITLGRYPSPSIPEYLPQELQKNAYYYQLGVNSLFFQDNPGQVIRYYLYDNDVEILSLYAWKNNMGRLTNKDKLILQEAIKQNLQAYPSLSSVMVIDNYIIVCFNQRALDKLKEDISTGGFEK